MLQRALLFTVVFAISLTSAAVNESSEGESVNSGADASGAADSKTVEHATTSKDNATDGVIDAVREDSKQQVESRDGSATDSAQQNSADKSVTIRSQKMQQCLSLVDMNVLQSFKDRGLKLNRDIKKLCHDKQRNAAQSQAVGFAVEIQRSKDMSVFRHCGKIIDQSSSTMGQIMKTYFASDLRYIHICDRHIP